MEIDETRYRIGIFRATTPPVIQVTDRKNWKVVVATRVDWDDVDGTIERCVKELQRMEAAHLKEAA